LAGPAEDVVEKMALAQNSGTTYHTLYFMPEKKPRRRWRCKKGFEKRPENGAKTGSMQGV
jgi:hypothetical protein